MPTINVSAASYNNEKLKFAKQEPSYSLPKARRFDYSFNINENP